MTQSDAPPAVRRQERTSPVRRACPVLASGMELLCGGAALLGGGVLIVGAVVLVVRRSPPPH